MILLGEYDLDVTVGEDRHRALAALQADQLIEFRGGAQSISGLD